jgi:hypothetical protein
MKDIIKRLFYNETGQMFISGLIGLSLALLFRRVCKENCTIYIAPKKEDIEGKIFKLEDTCYKYSTYNVKCNNKDKQIQSYEGNGTPENQIKEQNFFTKLFA